MHYVIGLVMLVVIVIVLGVIGSKLSEKESHKVYRKEDLGITWYTQRDSGKRICAYSYKMWEGNKLDAYHRYYGNGNIIRDAEFDTAYLICGAKPIGDKTVSGKTSFDLLSLEYTVELMIRPIIPKVMRVNDTNIYIIDSDNVIFNIDENAELRSKIEDVLSTQESLNRDQQEILQRINDGKEIGLVNLSEFIKSIGASVLGSVIYDFIKNVVSM